MLSQRLKILREIFSKQLRIVWMGVGTLALMAGWFLYVPPLTAIQRANKELFHLKAETEEARMAVMPLRKGQLLVPPGIDQLSMVLKELNQLARSHQVQLLEMSPQTARPDQASGLFALPIELQLEGSFRAIGDFLGAVRQDPELGVAHVERFAVYREVRLLPRLRARVSLEIFLVGASGGS